MVEIYRSCWLLIITRVTAQYWRGIDTNNVTCITEAVQNSSILQEEARRKHLKNLVTTKKKNYAISQEDGLTNTSEPYRYGHSEHLGIQSHQHNTNKSEVNRPIDFKDLVKLSQNPNKYKLRIKLKHKQDQDIPQYPRDNEFYKGYTTHYPDKVRDDPEENLDILLGHRIIETKSVETMEKNTLVTKPRNKIEFYTDRPRSLSAENERNELQYHKNISQIHHKKIYRFQTESQRMSIDTIATTQRMKKTVKSNHTKDINYLKPYNFNETNSEEVKVDGTPKLRAKSKLNKNLNILRSTRIHTLYGEVSTVSQRTTRKRLPKNVSISEDLSPYAIEKQMWRLIRKYREDMNITIEVIGRTVEYNSIILLKITEAEKTDAYFRVNENKYADEVPEKKIIFIVHGLSVMGMRHLIGDENSFHKLLKYYTEKHLEKFDIYLIPIANPDGYAATCNSQAGQYWNKNMSPQTSCPGVALDRNFDIAWNSTQRISSCSPMYPGSMPFSEPETRAIRNVLHKYSHKIIAYIHVHASSYDEKIFKGDAILYPRGYTETQADDDKYIDLKDEIDEAMKNSSFRVLAVTIDTLYNWYGKVSGTSVDYASTVYGVPYAMEFVMQIYKGFQHHALEAIWKVLIDVVFNNIWKSLHSNTNDLNK